MGAYKKKNPELTSPSGIDRYHLAVILTIVLFSTFFSLFSLYRLSVFDPQFDTVIFNQAYWNTIHYGEIFSNSLEMGSHFGVHFSPILFTVLPLYYLIPGPELLFIIKSILIALGAVPVYLCARELLGPKNGYIISLIYFFSPIVHGVAYCDFYETSFLPLIIGLALWCYLTKRENLMVVCCCLSLLIKEDVSLIIFMIGLVGLWMNRTRSLRENWRFILIIILSILILLSFFVIIKPAFSNGNLESANQFLNQYHDIPGNLSDLNGKRITYLLQIFLPLLCIPFAAPSLLVIGIPSFLEILLSPNPEYFYVGQHYSALVIPVVFMSLILGMKRITGADQMKKRDTLKYLPYLVLLCSIGATILWSPFVPPLHYAIEGKHMTTWNHSPALHRVIDLIPEDVPLAAPMNILPFLTDRHDLYLEYNPHAEIILLDSHLPEYADGFLAKTDEMNKEYTVVTKNDGISLYVRSDNPDLISLMNQRISKNEASP